MKRPEDENPKGKEEMGAGLADEFVMVIEVDEPKVLSFKTVATRTVSFWYNEFSGWDEISHIMTGLFLGRIPHDSTQSLIRFVEDVNPMRPLGLVVSVVEKDELEGAGFIGAKMVAPQEWKACGVDHHLLPMVDFTAEVDIKDSIETIVKIRKCIEEGKSVFVHCKAGRARSAMICVVFMSLSVINPLTGMIYTVEEAAIILKDARGQVSLGDAKKAMANSIVREAINDWETYNLHEFNPDIKFERQEHFDQKLAAKELKEAVLALSAVQELIRYKEHASKQHTFKITSKRAGYVDEIIRLISKPHSEEWYFKLQNAKGSFEALINASPAFGEKDDKAQRQILIQNLKLQVEGLVAEKLDIVSNLERK